MKALLFVCALLAFSLPALAGTYTGIVSGVKHFHNGGVAVDLDGAYPNQKMTFYVPPEDAAKVGPLPPEGAKVTATGTQALYKGKPEIKIFAPDQWKW
jgi:hypothetical protein